MPRRNRREFRPSIDGEIWTRVIKRRREDCASLKEELVQKMIEDVPGKQLTSLSASQSQNQNQSQMKNPCDQLAHLLQHHFEISTNDALPNEVRRNSWSTVQRLLSQVDSHLGRTRTRTRTRQNDELPTATATATPTITTMAASSLTATRTPNTANATTANASSSSQNHGQSNASSSNHNNNKGEKETSTTTTSSKHQLSMHPSLANPPVLENGILSIAAAAAAAAAAAPPPYQRRSDLAIAFMSKKNEKKTSNTQNATKKSATTTTTTSVPIHPSLQQGQQSLPPKPTNNSPSTTSTTQSNTAAINKASDDMDISDSDNNDEVDRKPTSPMTTTTTTTTRKPVPTPKLPVVEKPQEKPTISSSITEVRFDVDKDNSAGSVEPRPPIQVFFRKQFPTATMSRDQGRRFSMWEPYWKIAKVVHIGLTVPIDKLIPKKNYPRIKKTPDEFPKMAASFLISSLKPEILQLFHNNCPWGQEQGEPKDGEYRLLFRMLPLKINEAKKKRADCHLWPKGTFFAVNGYPIRLWQRKQQSHDPRLWKGMSRHLDMGQVLLNPAANNRIDICFHDTEQYIFSLAVCQYQAPLTLTKHLLSSDNNIEFLQRLSYEESMKKAMRLINEQTVVLEDDDEDVLAASDKKFVFSLVCPLSKVPMKTPVRGKHCKHWQVGFFHLHFFDYYLSFSWMDFILPSSIFVLVLLTD